MLDIESYQKQVIGAADLIRGKIDGPAPRAGVILGSGLGALVNEIEGSIAIPYEEIPGFPVSTAPGHSGTLNYGRIGDTPVVAFEGRFHFYEGYSLAEITLPVRVMARLGIETVVISSASGGLNREFEKGDLLLIDDHINMIGDNPLRGPNIDDWGDRFPDMCAPYDADLLRKMEEICQEEGIRARTGVYVALAGPCLETRAEYRMLGMLGADCVGMSTCPEVIVGVHEGLKMAGVSVVTDLCFPDELEPVSVEEILQVAAEAEPKLTKVVRRLLESC
ncbi:MAG: purine-nucleoside phosphorylase [Planctomycetota bacterium]